MMVYVGNIYNTDISDHPNLDLPILYLYKAFTGKFALCLGLYIAFISPGKHKCQATRFLAACQYPWITGS